MKTDTTGTHIAAPQNAIIQTSQSQANSVAFMDTEGHWIHLDANTIHKLSLYINKAQAKPAPKPAPASVSMALPSNADSPFDDLFKV